MLTDAINSLFGFGVNLLGLLTAFLPDFSLDSLQLALPESVRGGLPGLNWFVPIGHLSIIFNVWVAAIVAANVAFALRSAAAGKD